MELTKRLNTDSRRGPPTQFHPWHLLTAFYAFCQSPSPIGRYQLGSDLGLGGGSIRSLVRFLRERNLIEPIHRQGHQLSLEGQRYCNHLKKKLIKFVELPQSSYTIDVYNFGCHLRKLAHRITDGLSQRDAAMQAGASGATTFIQDSDPETMIMAKNHQIPIHELADILKPFTIEPKDVLIIGSGSNRIVAKLGAFAAILTLLD
ncbi:MAG: hypothetical protein Q6361_09545 [Candidatus Hermodarchaeota archaeon]|jgi:predicted transcriptional regulator|nr:hypothetical protein [Candidatus Hermodarchaeota archaeon]